MVKALQIYEIKHKHSGPSPNHSGHQSENFLKLFKLDLTHEIPNETGSYGRLNVSSPARYIQYMCNSDHWKPF